MKAKKQILGHLTKCYCVAPLVYHNKKHYLVASEKDYSCLLFDEEGNLVATVWEHPGGTMSAVQLPEVDGAFLATQRFYSPDNSKNARIIMAFPCDDRWNITTLAELPHVHRFDILKRDGILYLIACTLCSGRDYKGDWSYPGKVYGCRLPEDIKNQDENYRLPLIPIKENLLKNHGYSRWVTGGLERGIVTCEEGVFCITPPGSEQAGWQIDQLLDIPVSDGVLVDFDGDGYMELLTISPFHGDTIRIYHLNNKGRYEVVYEHPEKLPFAHGICFGNYMGNGQAVIGNREGKRELFRIYWNAGKSKYETQVLDKDAGSANILWDGDKILSANREKDEIAWYLVGEGNNSTCY